MLVFANEYENGVIFAGELYKQRTKPCHGELGAWFNMHWCQS